MILYVSFSNYEKKRQIFSSLPFCLINTYIDEATGLEKESRECRIEFLLPLKYAYKMVFGVEENAKVDESDIPNKIVTHGKGEEYPI